MILIGSLRPGHVILYVRMWIEIIKDFMLTRYACVILYVRMWIEISRR